MKKRYERNIGTISRREQQHLKEKRVCVIGCGGLGGGVMENLVRMGVGHITVVDGDVFVETNLNRQVLSNEGNIGKPKSEEAAKQMKLINSDVEVTSVNDFICRENICEVISGHDVVVDALDSAETRKLTEAACEEKNIPLVHGAIAGWSGQVAVVMPGDRLLEKIYAEDEKKGEECQTGNPSFTPAVVSAIEAAETIKLLTGKSEILHGRMLMIDLLNHIYETIDFGE